MTIKIVFSTGKVIELTQEEYAELAVKEKTVYVPYDNTPHLAPFIQPVIPYYPNGYPTITCSTATAKG